MDIGDNVICIKEYVDTNKIKHLQINKEYKITRFVDDNLVLVMGECHELVFPINNKDLLTFRDYFMTQKELRIKKLETI